MTKKSLVFVSALAAVCASAAAFAVPLERRSLASSDSALVEADWWAGAAKTLSRATAGDAVMIDARLGHSALAPGGSGETLLFAQITGGEAARAVEAPPMHLALVVDRSGSMRGAKIENAMNAAIGAVERMRDGDFVTVVAFDTTSQVVVSPTRVSEATRGSISAAIRSIHVHGDTCISCGLESAMGELARAPIAPDEVTRVLLLSDGQANFGVRDVDGLRAIARRLRDRGVTVSTIGVDVDFDEKVMAAIASEGNGKHHFAANAAALPAIFSEEFDSVLAAVGRDTELRVELGAGVEVVEVFDRPFRREGNQLIVPFGTVSKGQEKTVLARLRVPTTTDGPREVAKLTMAYRDVIEKKDKRCDLALALRVTSDGSASKELDPFVAARLERSLTAKTLTEVNRLFERGEVEEASRTLTQRQSALRESEKQVMAAATARPDTRPRRAVRTLDRDFAEQRAALDSADPFAAAKSAGGGAGAGFGRGGPAATGHLPGTFAAPPAAAPGDVAARARVRSNQAAASDMAF